MLLFGVHFFISGTEKLHDALKQAKQKNLLCKIEYIPFPFKKLTVMPQHNLNTSQK